jgi:hypothetical protein
MRMLEPVGRRRAGGWGACLSLQDVSEGHDGCSKAVCICSDAWSIVTVHSEVLSATIQFESLRGEQAMLMAAYVWLIVLDTSHCLNFRMPSTFAPLMLVLAAPALADTTECSQFISAPLQVCCRQIGLVDAFRVQTCTNKHLRL